MIAVLFSSGFSGILTDYFSKPENNLLSIKVQKTRAAGEDNYKLGEIPDKTISEGEFLNFTIEAPSNFGPDVTWTATIPDLTENELEGMFYDVPAFPGAEGYGAGTSGGRGGRVIKVTNLNSDGPGSLKEALLVNEPRIIVFDVSGVINSVPISKEYNMAKAGRFYTANAPVTIAGQTAPGAGITLNAQLNFADGDRGAVTDNAIARFLRIRNPYHRPGVGDNIDFNGNRGILDHISGAWGNDENYDLSHLKTGTIQWCGIEEAAGYGAPWEVYTDRDRDGMIDYWEIKARAYDTSDAVTDYVWHIKPSEDLDGDGATNLEEYNSGTNPLVANAPVDPEWIVNYDSDSDGMADWWEQKAIDTSNTGSVASLADMRPDDDLDGDLSTNLEEHEAGTDPLRGPTHNYGMIMGYTGKDISLHHNFFAHHLIRTPLTGVEVLDHRNNVIYNAGLGITWHSPRGNRQGPGEPFKTNIVGNYFKPGPNALKEQNDPTYFYPFIEGAGRSIIYGEGNYFAMVDEPNGYLDMFNPDRRGVYDGDSNYRADIMFPAPDVTTHTAEKAYGLVTAHAGSLPRDAVTSRNLEEIKTRTGKWGKEMPAGGLTEGLTPASPKTDRDNDGMPDEWENAVITVQGNTVNRGTILNPAVQDHNTIVKAGESVLMYNGQPVAGTENRYKGLTYIEYYINELADQLILKELIAAGYDQTDLPGYGKRPKPTFSWTPGYEQAGEYDIIFTASDGTNTASQTVKVSVSNVNRKPLIYPAMLKDDGQSVSGHLWETVEPGESFNFKFYVTDPDNDDLAITMINKPDGAIITDTGRTTDHVKSAGDFFIYEFEWYSTLADVGWSNTISIVATDTFGDAHTRDFMLKVNEPSNPVYTITAQAGAGGKVDPRSGEVLIQEGNSITFFMQADDDYALSDVIVDGVSVGVKGEHAFNNVNSNHSIEAVFKYDQGVVGGLIMHLDFDGDMRDSSVFGNHGTADGDNMPALAVDRFGNPNGAYDFDGVDDYIRVQDSNIFDSLGYTVATWAYVRNSWYPQQYVISKNTRTGPNGLGLYSNWDWLFVPGSGYPHSDLVLGGQGNRWMHLAASRDDKGVVNFYLNGEHVGQDDTYPNAANDLDLIIGALNANAPSNFFNGFIDDVKIYNVALSGETIKQEYLKTKPDQDYDTTPPSVPANLQGSVSGENTINLTWTKSTDAEPGILRYEIYRDNKNIGETSASSPSYSDTGLATGATYTYSVSAVNILGLESAKSTPVSVVVEKVEELQIVDDFLPDGTVNNNYNHPLSITGGSAPYTYSIILKSVPDGLSLNFFTGAISGIPTTEGVFDFTIQVHDSVSRTVNKDLSIKIEKEYNTGSFSAKNLNIVSSNWPDSSNMKQFSLDAIRLMNATTNEEKAQAIFRFIRMFTSKTDGNPPREKTLDNNYIDDPMKVLNVYGAHWCDGLARLLEAGWRALGFRAEKLVRDTHTMADVHWEDEDGIERWHLFDVSRGRYTYNRDGTHMASADELGLDNSLFVIPSKGPIVGIIYSMEASFWSPHLGLYKFRPINHSMADTKLRLGEKFTRYSYEAFPAYQNNFGYKNITDFKHGPYTINSGSGAFEYSPDFTKNSFKKGLYENSQNLISIEDDGVSPNLHTSVAGETGTAIFEIKSPYIISDSFISGNFYKSSSNDEIKISISTDQGSNWKNVWTAGQTGNIILDNLDIAESFDVYTNPPADLISPFGRYDYLLKIEVKAQNNISDAGVNGLKITTNVQHNIFSMPMLWPGKNDIIINGSAIEDVSLKITYEWDDLMGQGRKNVAVVEEFPYVYEIVTSGNKWEDVILKSVTMEALPKDGLGNRVLLKEERPAIVTNIGPADAFPTEKIVGSYYPKPLKTVQEYLADLNSTDTGKQKDALAGLIILNDSSALTKIESVAFESIDPFVKTLAVQAIYHIGGSDSFETLKKFLRKDPEIKWKYDANDPSVERGHWYSLASATGHLVADANEKSMVPDLMYVLDDMVATGNKWKGPELSIVRSLGRLGDSQAIPSIRPTLSKDGDEVVWAIWSLGELNDTDSISQIKTIFEKSIDDDCYSKYSSRSCYELYPMYAAEALAKLGGSSILPGLYKMLKHYDEDYRGYAAEALGTLGNSDNGKAVQELQKLLLTETFPWVKKNALNSIAILNGDKTDLTSPTSQSTIKADTPIPKPPPSTSPPQTLPASRR